ncbi:MAG: hypothetical protein ACI93R_002465 [Flavobacteriales bacterium]|jgi:hypothetical protein
MHVKSQLKSHVLLGIFLLFFVIFALIYLLVRKGNTTNYAESVQRSLVLQNPEERKPLKVIRNNYSALKKNTEPSDIDTWLKAVKSSNKISDLTITAIINRFPDQQEKILLQAYGIAPNDLLVNHQILRFCSDSRNSPLCSIPYMETLLKADPDNGQLKLDMATDLYTNSDVGGALAALQSVVKSKTVDDYTWRYQQLFDSSFGEYGFSRTRQSIESMLGIMAAVPDSSFFHTVNMCREQVEAPNKGWKEACAKASLTQYQLGSTSIRKEIGLSMAKKYSSSPEVDFDIKRIELHEQLSESFKDAGVFDESLNGILVIPDSVWNRYLGIYKADGEIVAVSYLMDQFRILENYHK